MLKLDLPDQLVAEILRRASNLEFAALDDKVVEGLLLSESEVVRKVTALKVNHALPTRRLRKILADYESLQTKRYYNVIYWLDLGASLPSADARKAAKKALTEMSI